MFAEASARVAPIKQVKTSHKVHSSRMTLFWDKDQSDILFIYFFIFGIGVECGGQTAVLVPVFLEEMKKGNQTCAVMGVGVTLFCIAK